MGPKIKILLFTMSFFQLLVFGCKGDMSGGKKFTSNSAPLTGNGDGKQNDSDEIFAGTSDDTVVQSGGSGGTDSGDTDLDNSDDSGKDGGIIDDGDGERIEQYGPLNLSVSSIMRGEDSPGETIITVQRLKKDGDKFTVAKEHVFNEYFKKGQKTTLEEFCRKDGTTYLRVLIRGEFGAINRSTKQPGRCLFVTPINNEVEILTDHDGNNGSVCADPDDLKFKLVCEESVKIEMK